QIETLAPRIAAVRRALKEAQTVRMELAGDLDYRQRRLAGEPSDQLIEQRLAATRRRKAAATGGRPAEPSGNARENDESA
ncbi:MerR family transcriptional regulator, partial [Paraburkholderia sp. BR14262]